MRCRMRLVSTLCMTEQVTAVMRHRFLSKFMRMTIAVTMGMALLWIYCGCSKEPSREKTESQSPRTLSSTAPAPAVSTSQHAAESRDESKVPQAAHLPKLIDLGRGTCIPCKKMAPILAELKAEYDGRAIIEVIDLRDPEGRPLAEKYHIRLIPTQIFFDADGKEVWRHEGFMPKADIVAKLREIGVKDR